MGLLKKYGVYLFLIAATLALALGVTTKFIWWPKISAAVDKMLISDDHTASNKIEEQGQVATNAAVVKQEKTAAYVKARTRDVTAQIAASPSAKTSLPPDDIVRLRSHDAELCKLGVVCNEGSPSQPSGPAATSLAPKSPGAVRASNPSDAGNTDLR